LLGGNLFTGDFDMANDTATLTTDTTAQSNGPGSGGGIAQGNVQFDALVGRGKEYLDGAVDAAKNKPWTAAAIGAGVVAATAATAYGATKLAQHLNDSNSGGNGRSGRKTSRSN
jgi:hypothetical protein